MIKKRGILDDLIAALLRGLAYCVVVVLVVTPGGLLLCMIWDDWCVVVAFVLVC